MSTGCHGLGEGLLAPRAFSPKELVLGHQLVSLPRFARLYRNAFKSGAGKDLHPLRQLVSRLGYYALGALFRGPRFGSMELELHGRKRILRFDCTNRQFNSLYFAKYAAGYEPPVSACLLSLLPPDGVLYDVGSNWGYYSLLAARQAGFRGRVHAFEPWPPSFADLSSIVRQGGLENIVTTHHMALAAESGQAVMSSGRHSGLARLVTGGRGPRVPKGTIDELGLDRPDFIKLDVEGFETEVLRGGKKTIGDARPFIVFESSTQGSSAQTEAVMQLLEDWNYRLVIPALSAATGGPESRLSIEAIPPGPGPLRLALHPVTRRTRELHREYLNILAVPSDRWSRVESLVESA